MILDDYLPTAAVSDSIMETYDLFTSGTYVIQIMGDSSAMTTKENWDSLLTGTINGHAVSETRTSNVWAMGSPDIELWVNSWNSNNGYTTLYTLYDDNVNDFWYAGYYIGDSANPTTNEIDLSSETGYNNPLYFPHQESIDSCNGYWLASPAAGYAGFIERVESNGLITVDDWDAVAFRPIIRFPSSVVNQ